MSEMDNKVIGGQPYEDKFSGNVEGSEAGGDSHVDSEAQSIRKAVFPPHFIAIQLRPTPAYSGERTNVTHGRYRFYSLSGRKIPQIVRNIFLLMLLICASRFEGPSHRLRSPNVFVVPGLNCGPKWQQYLSCGAQI